MSFESRQETIKNLLTCGICRKLCREFTIIDECCHTFCKKCITQKITEENLRNCPKCNADLGCTPLQKLKPDYRWQNLRNKYVEIRELLIDNKLMRLRGRNRASEALNQANDQPPAAPALAGKQKGKEEDRVSADQAPVVDRKGKKKLFEISNETMGPQLVPSGELSPTRRKEKSMSSLAGISAKSNVQLTATIAAAPVRKKRNYIRRKTVPTKRASLSGMGKMEVNDKDISASSDNMVGNCKHQLENPYALEPWVQQVLPINSQEYAGEASENINELLKHMDELAGGVDKSKLRKGRPEKEEKNGGIAEDLNIPTQAVVDSSTICERKTQIWFRFVACKKQVSAGLIPRFPSSCYIAVNDVNMPAFFIKIYLAEKLGFKIDKLEISMMGHPIHPEMPMHQLIEMWMAATKPERRKLVTVGSSGKKFVMVFTYKMVFENEN